MVIFTSISKQKGVSKVCIIKVWVCFHVDSPIDFPCWNTIMDRGHLAVTLCILSCNINHLNRPRCRIGRAAIIPNLENSISKLLYLHRQRPILSYCHCMKNRVWMWREDAELLSGLNVQKLHEFFFFFFLKEPKENSSHLPNAASKSIMTSEWFPSDSSPETFLGSLEHLYIFSSTDCCCMKFCCRKLTHAFWWLFHSVVKGTPVVWICSIMYFPAHLIKKIF